MCRHQIQFEENSFRLLFADCSALQNVEALEVSPSGLLYAADSGVASLFSNPLGAGCPAKFVVLDLADGGEVAAVHILPDEVVAPGRGLLRHMVLVPAQGRGNGLILASDVSAGAVVALDLETGRSWRVRAEAMAPTNVGVRVAPMSSQVVSLRSGVAGMAVEIEVS